MVHERNAEMKAITFEQFSDLLDERNCELCVGNGNCREENCVPWNGLPDVEDVPEHSNALLDSLLKFSMNECNCGGSFIDINGRKRCVCMAAADRIRELEKRWQERQR